MRLEVERLEQLLLLILADSFARVDYVHFQHLLDVVVARLYGYLAIVGLLQGILRQVYQDLLETNLVAQELFGQRLLPDPHVVFDRA